jgi:SNF2 family DNA or RNA helicase
MEDSVKFKTTPYQHQLEDYNNHKDKRVHALFHQMGCGKTWIVINTAIHLKLQDKIQAVFVIAPNGVHSNWVSEELPAHCGHDYAAVAYHASKSKTKTHMNAVKALLKSPPTQPLLPVLTMSYDALITKKGQLLAETFLNQYECLLVADECHKLKSNKAKRTKVALKLARQAPYKRILTGTPITQRPLDVYNQVRFLDETFWRRHGTGSFLSFKHQYAQWRTQFGSRGRYEQLVGYRNLDELRDLLGHISTRVLKADVLGLPPKVYVKRRFELPPPQRRLYEELRKSLQLQLSATTTLTAPLAITLLLRLQELACGYMRDDAGNMHLLQPNPRIAALGELIDDSSGKMLIFARFKQDIRQIVQFLYDTQPFGSYAVYEGATSINERQAGVTMFQNEPNTRFFVGNLAACSTGLTLSAAETVVYYSNSFDLEQRLQSEDRAHRIGTEKSVLYVDLIAEKTVDERLVEALRSKRSIAAEVVRDNIGEWI